MTAVKVRRVSIIGLLIFTTTATAGCDYLLGLQTAPNATRAPSGDVPLPPTGPEDDPEASFDPGDPFGAAEATYRSGTATLTVGDDVISLDRLAGPGTYFAEFGADVIWTGDDGWYVGPVTIAWRASKCAAATPAWRSIRRPSR